MKKAQLSKFSSTAKALLIACLAISQVNAQSELPSGLGYEVSRIYPSLSETQEALAEAKSISELNPYFKSEWVKEIKSVEVVTTSGNNQRVVKGITQEFNEDQIASIKSADIGSEMSVLVRYLPDNDLGFNDVKEFDFDCVLDPERDATFPGGSEELNKYILSSPVGQLTQDQIRQYLAAIVTFVVDEDGEITDAKIHQSSDNDEVDKQLLATVCDMPNWLPAEYRNSKRIKQEYALVVGDLMSCTINTLNTRQTRTFSRDDQRESDRSKD